mmetsp:Transcript_7449/g.6598  ORF Transcript_7449/g.6598 Transcript_7449/m.6598 type:complete len:131 (-) Transcript_7449:21-413(-)
MLANKNYRLLVKIHERFRDQGFQILAFPCNQFLGQEACSNYDIKEFVKKKYGAEFQMMAKAKVNGEESHEVYKYCRKNSDLRDPKTGKLKSIPWNFSKFIINKKGEVKGFYSPKEDPKDMIKMIQELVDE